MFSVGRKCREDSRGVFGRYIRVLNSIRLRCIERGSRSVDDVHNNMYTCILAQPFPTSQQNDRGIVFVTKNSPKGEVEIRRRAAVHAHEPVRNGRKNEQDSKTTEGTRRSWYCRGFFSVKKVGRRVEGTRIKRRAAAPTHESQHSLTHPPLLFI